MNLTDLLIIYLACGSPLGVYYFLHNRRHKNAGLLWLKTLLIFMVWLPFAARLYRRKIIFSASPSLESKNGRNLDVIQKQIEAMLAESSLPISIYDFREVFARYVGLASVSPAADETDNAPEKEILRVSSHSNIELANVCYQRRNRKRLLFHHTLARQDFLNLIAKLSASHSMQKKLGILAVEFVNILNDADARAKLEVTFAEILQTKNRFAVPNLEEDLWKPERHKPLPVQTISKHLPTITAATNSRGRD